MASVSRAYAKISVCVLGLRLHSDSTAAIGVCRRRGLGRIRHLAVADLWLQDKIKSNELSVHKVAGKDSPADVLTKSVDVATLQKALARMRIEPEEGRANSASKI